MQFIVMHFNVMHDGEIRKLIDLKCDFEKFYNQLLVTYILKKGKCYTTFLRVINEFVKKHN